VGGLCAILTDCELVPHSVWLAPEEPTPSGGWASREAMADSDSNRPVIDSGCLSRSLYRFSNLWRHFEFERYLFQKRYPPGATKHQKARMFFLR
jgi:hypothetical protein